MNKNESKCEKVESYEEDYNEYFIKGAYLKAGRPIVYCLQ